ncbi:hypothetical protein [Paenibacillus sp. LjRoot56]|uniref:hypothetical protein n=1 Tax=Paenibacillus sp. LjRoot56 TaxID=3342333 RepID=UPI003ED012F4
MQPGVREGLHDNLDLLPTLAEMLGSRPAESYAESLTVGNVCRDYLVVSKWPTSASVPSALTIGCTYALIMMDIIDLERDAIEFNNIASKRPDIVKQAVYYLMEWHDEWMASMTCDVDPMWTVIREGGPFHAKGFQKN